MKLLDTYIKCNTVYVCIWRSIYLWTNTKKKRSRNGEIHSAYFSAYRLLRNKSHDTNNIYTYINLWLELFVHSKNIAKIYFIELRFRVYFLLHILYHRNEDFYRFLASYSDEGWIFILYIKYHNMDTDRMIFSYFHSIDYISVLNITMIYTDTIPEYLVMTLNMGNPFPINVLYFNNNFCVY